MRTGRAIAVCIRNRRRRAGAELRGRRSARHLPGMIGVIQATEAVKIILGIGETLKNRLLLYDALGHAFPGVEAAARSQLPGLRRPSDRHQADRLSGILRN